MAMKSGPKDLETLGIRPMSEDETMVMVGLIWLAKEELPLSIRHHFVERIEDALSRLLPKEKFEAVRGCDAAEKYEAAFQTRGQKP